MHLCSFASLLLSNYQTPLQPWQVRTRLHVLVPTLSLSLITVSYALHSADQLLKACSHMAAIAFSFFVYERGLEFPAISLYPDHHALRNVQLNLDFISDTGYMTMEQRKTFLEVCLI
jgi:hypothetical protein